MRYKVWQFTAKSPYSILILKTNSNLQIKDESQVWTVWIQCCLWSGHD